MTLPTGGLGRSMNYKLGMGTYCAPLWSEKQRTHKWKRNVETQVCVNDEIRTAIIKVLDDDMNNAYIYK